MSDDICDWLAEEEAAAEQWGGLGGAQFYRERFAAARAEIERLRAAGDALADSVDLTQFHLTQFVLAAEAWREARRERQG